MSDHDLFDAAARKTGEMPDPPWIAPIAMAEAEIGPTRRNPMPPSAYDASLASRQPRDPYGSGVTQRSPRRPRDRLAALLSSTRFETSPLWSDMP